MHNLFYIRRLEHMANAITNALSARKTDVILTSNTPICAAFLETNIPVVFWTDYVFAGIVNFYPAFRRMHSNSNWDAHFIMEACLTNARLLIFSSQWAARNAVEFYGIAKEKIKIVPFGANLNISHTLSDVKSMIQSRSAQCIKLLFVGRCWHRKGGDIVLETAKALHTAGYPVELTIVGCEPDEPLPEYVKCEGLISKESLDNTDKLKKLYQESHFLFVPSRTEAFGIVFCEANAYGVPCISTYVGGIPEVIKDGINGMTFFLEATTKQYCDYIVTLFQNRNDYETLALSAFNEYQTRLNWHTSAQLAKEFIQEIL